MQTGVVKSWNGSRGFGFITCKEIDGDILFMRSELPPDAREVRGKFLEGKTVTFKATTGQNGRAQGTDIEITAKSGDFVAGQIKSFSDHHGYGFLTSSSLSSEVRFNRSDLDAVAPGTDLRGELIIAKVSAMPDGRLRADQIMFQSQKIANRLKTADVMSYGMFQPSSGKGGFRPPFGKGHAGIDAKGGWGGFTGFDMGYWGYDGFSGKGGFGGTGKGSPDGEEKLEGTQGCVISYNAGKGFGFIKCGKSAADVYFKAEGEYQPGMIVAFQLKMNRDGRPSALNLQQGIAPGQTYTGTVKTFVENKGFGFISVPGQLCDVYFVKDLVPPALQNIGLVGKTARFTVKVSADGKPRAELGAQFY
eukprot:gb/GFBE01004176.1/.p1 GENE.gb/GFBE01004176.1/~~gb/GFBE01004176.1/.p1  ORF type:complete len:362 (+),score=91.33 gb/GFBE01004176.1/:1-1086(+)